jgi:hypothetical protein
MDEPSSSPNTEPKKRTPTMSIMCHLAEKMPSHGQWVALSLIGGRIMELCEIIDILEDGILVLFAKDMVYIPTHAILTMRLLNI